MIPDKGVAVTTSLTLEIGGVVKTYTTSLMVQTVRQEEIERTTALSWVQTLKAVKEDAPTTED